MWHNRQSQDPPQQAFAFGLGRQSGRLSTHGDATGASDTYKPRTSVRDSHLAHSNLPSASPHGGRPLVSQISRPQSIAVAVKKTADASPCATSTRVLCIVVPPPSETSSPERVSFGRITFHPGAGGFGDYASPLLSPARDSRQETSVSPFVVLRTFALCSGTTRSTWRNGSRLPCREHRLAPASSYSGHTPPLRALKHRGISTPTPDTTPAPAEVPALAMVFVRWVTSVEGVSPRAYCWMVEAPASTPFAADAKRPPISGDRNQKLPRTRQQRSFPVRCRLRSNSPARAFAPFMVELFAVGCFARTPSLTRPGSNCRQSETPHAGQVERARRPEPPVQDSHPLCTITASMT